VGRTPAQPARVGNIGREATLPAGAVSVGSSGAGLRTAQFASGGHEAELANSWVATRIFARDALPRPPDSATETRLFWV
jgi:hypothetical protein